MVFFNGYESSKNFSSLEIKWSFGEGNEPVTASGKCSAYEFTRVRSTLPRADWEHNSLRGQGICIESRILTQISPPEKNFGTVVVVEIFHNPKITFKRV